MARKSKSDAIQLIVEIPDYLRGDAVGDVARERLLTETQTRFDPIREAAREIIYQCGLGGYGPELPDDHPLLNRGMEEIQKAVDYITGRLRKGNERLRRERGLLSEVNEARVRIFRAVTAEEHNAACGDFREADDVLRMFYEECREEDGYTEQEAEDR